MKDISEMNKTELIEKVMSINPNVEKLNHLKRLNMDELRFRIQMYQRYNKL